MIDREEQIRLLLPLVRRIARRIARVVGGADLDDLVGVCDLASAVDAVRRLSAVEAGPRRSVPATRLAVDRVKANAGH